MARKRQLSGTIKRPKRPRFIRLGADFSGMDMPARSLTSLGVPFIHVFGSDNADHCRRYMTAVTKPQPIYHDVRTRDVATMAETGILCG